MRHLRVAVLVHEELIPPDTLDGVDDPLGAGWKTEFDVISTLRELGHEVRPVGLVDDLSPIRRIRREWKPHVMFNLLEEFHGSRIFVPHVVSYLELVRQPYTGCNPRGILLARDKALCKKVLIYHRIPTARFAVFPLGRKVKRPKRLEFPLLVKSVIEEASLGIAHASIVTSDEKLAERVEFIHRNTKADALVEQYIEGRELYLGVIGNHRLQTFMPWEMVFTKMPDHLPKIATAKVKWDSKFQKRHGITTKAAEDLPEGAADRIMRLGKRLYRILSLSGYARIDLRLDEKGQVYVLEVNPNPHLEYGEDFAESAHKVGIPYDQLLQRILNLALRYEPGWHV